MISKLTRPLISKFSDMPIVLPPGVNSLGEGGPAWALPMWKDWVLNTGNMGDPTDTHAQTINASQANGFYLPFASNVLVRTDRGLQASPTRTNSIPNPPQAGTVAGTPGTAPTGVTWSSTGNGLTRTIVGTGTDPTTGLTYVDVRFAGTSTALFDIILDPIQSAAGVAAASGQTWTSSVYLALIAGAFPGTSRTVDVRGRDAANALTESFNVSFNSASATPARFICTGTYVNAATVKSTMAIRINAVANGAVVDFTLRIINPQLELGPFASPPIAANQTTNGNQQVYTGLGTQLATGVAGFVQADLRGLEGTCRFIEFNDGTGNNRLLVGQGGTNNVQIVMSTGGVVQAQVFFSGAAAPGIVTVAFVGANNYVTGRVAGQAAPSPDTSSPNGWPVVNRFSLGGQGYAAATNSYLFTRKVSLRYLTPSDDPATAFAEAYAKAQLAAAA